MDKQIWGIAGGLTAVFLIAVLALVASTKAREAARARAGLAEVQAATARAEGEANALREQLAESQARIVELEQEKETFTQSRQRLEDEMRAALESRDVTISQLQGKLTVNILDRVLFDSGEAQLRSGGEAVLLKVAAILAQHPNLQIHVVGHTDNVPIRASARSRFASNWELSTARACSAVRFLTEKGGVNPHRLGVVGYGEFRPLADNGTVEGRSRNRRIAITILPDELAGADAPAPGTGIAPLPIAPGPDVPVNP
jgi:chemotaxis protein MotB